MGKVAAKRQKWESLTPDGQRKRLHAYKEKLLHCPCIRKFLEHGTIDGLRAEINAKLVTEDGTEVGRLFVRDGKCQVEKSLRKIVEKQKKRTNTRLKWQRDRAMLVLRYKEEGHISDGAFQPLTTLMDGPSISYLNSLKKEVDEWMAERVTISSNDRNAIIVDNPEEVVLMLVRALAKRSQLSDQEVVHVKISGDGARMGWFTQTGHTFVTVHVLNDIMHEENVFVIAQSSAPESDLSVLPYLLGPAQRVYDRLHNQTHAVDGVPYKFMVWFGADLKFATLSLGLEVAPGHGENAQCCLYCACSKKERYPLVLSTDRVLRSIEKMQAGPAEALGIKRTPALVIDSKQTVMDLMHCVLRMGDQDMDFLWKLADNNDRSNQFVLEMTRIVHSFKVWKSKKTGAVELSSLTFKQMRSFYELFDATAVFTNKEAALEFNTYLRDFDLLFDILLNTETDWTEEEICKVEKNIRKLMEKRVQMLGTTIRKGRKRQVGGQSVIAVELEKFKIIGWYCHLLAEHLGDTLRHLMQYGLTLHDFLQQVIEHTMSRKKADFHQTSKGGGRASMDKPMDLRALIQSEKYELRRLFHANQTDK